MSIKIIFRTARRWGTTTWEIFLQKGDKNRIKNILQSGAVPTRVNFLNIHILPEVV